jgi:hypothetical protein
MIFNLEFYTQPNYRSSIKNIEYFSGIHGPEIYICLPCTHSPKATTARSQWLIPIILATQEIRRIAVQGQRKETV